MSEEKLKIAVVGLGKMGILHSCILNVLSNVQLVALCEKSSMIRRLAKKIFKTSIVDDVEKLAHLDIDAVYVTTPIPSHFPIVKTICQEKLAHNLFVEKTLAANYNEAKELCELAGRFSEISLVGYMRRFAVTFKKAKELLTEDTVGNVESFKAYALSSDFHNSQKSVKTSAARGGVLRDLGCHVVDLALWFFGDLQVNSATLTPRISDDSEDHARFDIRALNDSLEGNFDVSWCLEGYRMPEVGLSISGSKGTIEVSDDKLELKLVNGKSFTWFRHNLGDNVWFWLGGPEYFRENEYFIKSIREGKKTEPNFNTASKVDQIIEQVKEKADKTEH
ncbi:Gfo/Idh/MocA family oxidoreductase [Candidatus Bathyarchaeota archaeon]|nr:Gfo/Idh/MocA family oxidoreductase [Candidatus Bathyarchaeota archaeon]